MTYSEIIETLTSRLADKFNEVYHSAEIITIDKDRYPAIPLADGVNWLNLATTDQEQIVYIRRAGDDQVLEELKLGGCDKAYKLTTPVRVVFFKRHADNFGEILFQLMQSVLVTSTKLRSIIHDKWRLWKDESSGDFVFGPDTAYFAIDLYINWQLIGDTCEQDFCVTSPNPAVKCQ